MSGVRVKPPNPLHQNRQPFPERTYCTLLLQYVPEDKNSNYYYCSIVSSGFGGSAWVLQDDLILGMDWSLPLVSGRDWFLQVMHGAGSIGTTDSFGFEQMR
jgi:hypothetical protein